jgi:hypothetical protein
VPTTRLLRERSAEKEAAAAAFKTNSTCGVRVCVWIQQEWIQQEWIQQEWWMQQEWIQQEWLRGGARATKGLLYRYGLWAIAGVRTDPKKGPI